MHKQIRTISCDICTESAYLTLKYQIVNTQLSIITNIFIKVITKPCAKCYIDALRNMDYFPISCDFCSEFDFSPKKSLVLDQYCFAS